jgi:protein involved in polysaccharide export with SLBB domain
MKKNVSFFSSVVIISSLITIGCSTKNPPPLSTKAPPVFKQTLEEYYLQPGDNLDIKCFYNPELNENVTIRPDGKISLQLIDEIQAAGLTPAQLDELLTKKYSAHLKQAMITVIVKDFGGQRIYVGGEVNSPQVLEVVGRVNALQAIFDAGGCREDAKLSSVMIVSRGPDNRPLARKVDLQKALEGELPEEDYLLRPYDMVYVPRSNLARADQFVRHLYSFIPPRVGLTFVYELHNEDVRTKSTVETIEIQD